MKNAIAVRRGNAKRFAILCKDPLVELDDAAGGLVQPAADPVVLPVGHEFLGASDILVQLELVVVRCPVAFQAENADFQELPELALADVSLHLRPRGPKQPEGFAPPVKPISPHVSRSEEQTTDPQSLMHISY